MTFSRISFHCKSTSFVQQPGAKGERDENHDDQENANSNEDKNPGRSEKLMRFCVSIFLSCPW